MVAAKKKAPAAKVKAGYRLPEALVVRVEVAAARLRVRPCVVVERALDASLASIESETETGRNR